MKIAKKRTWIPRPLCHVSTYRFVQHRNESNEPSNDVLSEVYIALLLCFGEHATSAGLRQERNHIAGHEDRRQPLCANR